MPRLYFISFRKWLELPLARVLLWPLVMTPVTGYFNSNDRLSSQLKFCSLESKLGSFQTSLQTMKFQGLQELFPFRFLFSIQILPVYNHLLFSFTSYKCSHNRFYQHRGVQLFLWIFTKFFFFSV